MEMLVKSNIHNDQNSFDNLLNQLRKYSFSSRDMGDKFERLMVQYLKIDPLYSQKYSEVWMWNDFPLRGNVGDVGIDLVAKEINSDNYCAIQCKFYDENHVLQKSDIDSFFTASGKDIYSSRIIISTTDKWSKNAVEALQNQSKPITRIRLKDLKNSNINWTQFDLDNLENMVLKEPRKLMKHQQEALNDVIKGFEENDRGQLIMACGTGKTFTSLRIAEELSKKTMSDYNVLFLVPSISLLAQTLREWNNNASVSLNCFAICSDNKVTKNENDDFSIFDLGFPATTKVETLLEYMKRSSKSLSKMSVYFSTYQSINVISEALKITNKKFNLIICDEAHRTTGVTLEGEEVSYFNKIHDNNFINGKKRLYMTATPKLFSDEVKNKVDEKSATLWSMDNNEIFGPVLHYLGFGQAVTKGLLSDYKVMVLAVDEKYVSSSFQKQIANKDFELTLDDAVKITGCWNGLSKRTLDQNGYSGMPMRRAVAFSNSINDSKKITELFDYIVSEYIQRQEDRKNILKCDIKHIDGTFDSLKRQERLDWLKEGSKDENICRILSNARCLTEGIDVPNLDAVMFLNPRKSIVDIVQAVGRVMRKAEGKEYGYIILPIGVPAGITAEEALNNNEKYKVVWQVLQALRAHDDRFNTMINQIDLNKKRPEKVTIIGIGEDKSSGDSSQEKQYQMEMELDFDIEEWRDAIYAKLVKKCGDRRYWESWAGDVAKIAQRHIERLNLLLEDHESEHYKAFEQFLKELRYNINEEIDEKQAIEMLSQHMITKPVFDSLFENYSFVKSNPVSVSMDKMISLLEEQALEKETKSLEKFYESVKKRAKGIDNSAGKQKIMIELYDKFFRTAFKSTTEKLGIVYTPVQIVDFIIKSVEMALRNEFNKSLTDKNVHVLDPFTGTGTFISRLLQSGLINKRDILRKYTQELHANEIVLLAYYIAAINIEETFHDLIPDKYTPFNGIVLTDTFKISEEKNTSFISTIFPENNVRVKKQNDKKILTIIGNPPYSIGQTNANDNNKNTKYKALDESIQNSYAKYSKSNYKKSLYDSYIRAIRWATNRLEREGIICFVTNGAFIDSTSMDGMRKSLEEEFSSIYCFNLRGNQRTEGEQSRKEGGKIFGAGCRATIAITLFIKKDDKKNKCDIYYHDIGDYLTREEKLDIISEYGDYTNIKWEKIIPNKHYDWINQRKDDFYELIPISDEVNKSIFNMRTPGLITNRDSWTYNYSKEKLAKNMYNMINVYNECIASGSVINNDLKSIKWSETLLKRFNRKESIDFDENVIVESMYRPFCKQWLYFDKKVIERPGQMERIFPITNTIKNNKIINITGTSSSKEFSVLMTNVIPNLDMLEKSRCFPLYYTEVNNKENEITFFDDINSITEEGISNNVYKMFREKYSVDINKEDIFYYIYAILHSKDYKTRFASELKKSLPRIMLVNSKNDFFTFVKFGRMLSDIHLNYEEIEEYPLIEEFHSDEVDYRVKKMRFGKNGKNQDKTKIIYNSSITLTGIPLEAYNYVVNGKSALEWIIKQYQVSIDKDSGIEKNPNDWSNNPKYIIELIKKIVTVSLKTNNIIDNLPTIKY